MGQGLGEEQGHTRNGPISTYCTYSRCTWHISVVQGTASSLGAWGWMHGAAVFMQEHTVWDAQRKGVHAGAPKWDKGLQASLSAKDREGCISPWLVGACMGRGAAVPRLHISMPLCSAIFQCSVLRLVQAMGAGETPSESCCFFPGTLITHEE